jgi:hypothetical protein
MTVCDKGAVADDYAGENQGTGLETFSTYVAEFWKSSVQWRLSHVQVPDSLPGSV